MKNSEYQMVVCIVNAGYTEVVMDAARSAGARGGTVIHGRGTASGEAEKIFQIVVQPDKDIIIDILEKLLKIVFPGHLKDRTFR